MTDYYQKQLQVGLEYQDFVCEVLLKEFGFPIITYASKKYQYTKGENKQGIEIKFQGKMKEYGNLYIETAEKSNERIQEYTKSGIYRDDLCWLFLTGDYETVYIFSTRHLRALHRKNRFRETEPKNIKTSKGFLMSIADADMFCRKKIKANS
jgi:hypothetical protein